MTIVILAAGICAAVFGIYSVIKARNTRKREKSRRHRWMIFRVGRR